MSLVKSYLSVLEEKNESSIVSGTEKLVGDLPGKTKEHVSANKVEGVEAPVEGPHSQQDPESEPKEVKAESTNPFDELYNKVLAEESWDYETEAEESPLDSDASSAETDVDMNLDFTAEPEDSEESEEEEMEPEGLEAVLDHLKSAVSALEKLVDEADEEEDEMEEEGMGMMDEEEEDEMEEMSDETLPEAVEAEVEGHALVDQEKLAKGLNKPASKVVKGAVSVTKGKAQVVKGAKVDGKPSPCTIKPETLTSKNNNVGGVKPGKDLFAQ
jgi:hypothetical protein